MNSCFGYISRCVTDSILIIYRQKLKVRLYLMHPISETPLLFGRFPGFTRFFFWLELHAYENGYGALVE
jgi:hypothetical protein